MNARDEQLLDQLFADYVRMNELHAKRRATMEKRDKLVYTRHEVALELNECDQDWYSILSRYFIQAGKNMGAK